MTDLPQRHVSFNANMADDDSAKLRSYFSPPTHDTEPRAASFNRTSLTSSSDSYPNSPETTELTGQLSRQPSSAGHYRPKEVAAALVHTNEVIDHSQSHNSEKVVEISPSTGRYLRLNTLLGKGAYKVVYKAIDREEGYEVAWNTVQVCVVYISCMPFMHKPLGQEVLMGISC